MAEQASPRPSLKIEETWENPLLSRREVYFTVIHEGMGTPDRWMIRQTLAELFKASVDCVIVKSLLTRAGSYRTKGHAHIYENKEELLRIEPRHIYIRNLPPKERAEALKALKEAKKGG